MSQSASWARMSHATVFRIIDEQRRNRKRILTPCLTACTVLVLVIVLFSLLARVWFSLCSRTDCPGPKYGSTSSVVRLNYDAAYEVFITEGRRSLDQARQLVSSRNAKLLDQKVYDAEVLKKIGSSIDQKAYWFFRDYNPKFIWTTSYIDLPAEDTRPRDVLVKFENSNSATRQKRDLLRSYTFNASSLVGIWCEQWDDMYYNTLNTIPTSDPSKTPLRIHILAEASFDLAAHENSKTKFCLRLSSEISQAHVGYVLMKMSSVDHDLLPRTNKPFGSTYISATTENSVVVESSTLTNNITGIFSPTQSSGSIGK